MYVPSLGTTSVVTLQPFGVWLAPHNFTVEGTSGALAAPGVSLARIAIAWLVSQLPVDVSSVATGGGAITGVSTPVSV